MPGKRDFKKWTNASLSRGMRRWQQQHPARHRSVCEGQIRILSVENKCAGLLPACVAWWFVAGL